MIDNVQLPQVMFFKQYDLRLRFYENLQISSWDASMSMRTKKAILRKFGSLNSEIYPGAYN